MFGGTFGAFETARCHFFDINHPTYLRIAAIARVRNQRDLTGLALRRGRQYLRETFTHGSQFSFPGAGELIAWSRILHSQEVLVALNTNGTHNRDARITVDASLHSDSPMMTFLYKSDWSDAELSNPPAGQTVAIESANGRATVRLNLPPAGMAILA
jgi:hypothetical protein